MDNMVVVDASIAIKWAVRETGSDIAEKLLADWKQQTKQFFAPGLFLYEITNILLKKVRQRIISADEAQVALLFILNTGIGIYSPSTISLNLQALEFAQTHKLMAAYDAHYLALAERVQCEFWTADERLYNSVKNKLPWVRLMADYRPDATSS